MTPQEADQKTHGFLSKRILEAKDTLEREFKRLGHNARIDISLRYLGRVKEDSD